MEAFRMLLAGTSGEITYTGPFDESPDKTPLYEYTWNHTTLQLLKTDRGITYLQSLFPAERLVEAVLEMNGTFGDEVLPHLEFIRFAGKVTASALQIVRYTTPERLDEIIAIHEAHGIMIANPHVYTLEEGSRHKRADADQLGFKHEVDPFGLLNPGKMKSFVPRAG
jgi:FAD/FMN-containing dehydrogenase